MPWLLPEADRKFARYLSLANLLRAGDGPGDMALYRNGDPEAPGEPHLAARRPRR